MTQTQVVNPDRLRQLRALRGLKSQEDLARTAHLNKQTVYRLENGRVSRIRAATVEKLCKALKVAPDVLAGKMPIPDGDGPTREPVEGDKYQVPGRVDGSTRNALSLVARRYRIPITRIVELAPLLFALAAEQSLERRRSKLAELEAHFDHEDSLRENFPHLPMTIAPSFEAADTIDEEKKSVADRDILGSGLSDHIFERFGPIQESYDAAEHNPFVTYLKEASSKYSSVIEIKSFHGHGLTNYVVCREDAMKLAGGDEVIAHGILVGWVQLHEIPRELLKDDAITKRMEWMRPRVEAGQKQVDEFWDEITQDLGEKTNDEGAEP